MLAKTAQLGKFDPTRLITNHFVLDLLLDAWDTFRRAAETTALKVIIGV